MDKPRKVVITGVGPITAIGTGKDELWNSVKMGRSNVVMHDQYIDGEHWDSFYLAKISQFDINDFRFSPKAIDFLKQSEYDKDRDLLYLLAAIKLALEDSRLKYDTEANDVGLILTHEGPGVDRYVKDVFQLALDIIEDKIPEEIRSNKKALAELLYQSHKTAVYNMHSFMYLYSASKVFGLHGYSLFINNACASGLFAIEAASQQIKSGGSDVMIVAGADHPVFITKYQWFKDLDMYAHDGIMRPFDKNRKGFVFGDGGSAIVLEEMEHAMNRGAFIYGEYLGGGFNQEAWKVSMPMVSERFYTKAFEQALRNSMVDPDEIDLVNPHGVATRMSDRYEARTINEIFQGSKTKPLITALKPYVGHNLGGSAIVELIILLMALKADLVPATLNFEQTDPELKLNLVNEPVPRDLNLVAKMSNGFAGYNAVGVFKKVASG